MNNQRLIIKQFIEESKKASLKLINNSTYNFIINDTIEFRLVFDKKGLNLDYNSFYFGLQPIRYISGNNLNNKIETQLGNKVEAICNLELVTNIEISYLKTFKNELYSLSKKDEKNINTHIIQAIRYIEVLVNLAKIHPVEIKYYIESKLKELISDYKTRSKNRKKEQYLKSLISELNQTILLHNQKVCKNLLYLVEIEIDYHKYEKDEYINDNEITENSGEDNETKLEKLKQSLKKGREIVGVFDSLEKASQYIEHLKPFYSHLDIMEGSYTIFNIKSVNINEFLIPADIEWVNLASDYLQYK